MRPDIHFLNRMGHGSGSGAVALHILDHFTDVDDTALSAHTPDINTPGNAWVATNGTWIITSNYAVCSVIGAEACGIALIDAGAATASLSVLVKGNVSGPCIRSADLNNFWLAYLSGTTLTLYERTTATWTSRASVAGTDAAPTTVVFSAVGNDLTASIGAKSCTYNSAVRNTTTKFGFYTESTNPAMDDFEVTP